MISSDAAGDSTTQIEEKSCKIRQRIAEIDAVSITNGQPKQWNSNLTTQQQQRPVLLKLQEMPEYLQFNPYIYVGYRPVLNFWGCLHSMSYFHNETVNIITHGIPILVILWQMPNMLPWEELRPAGIGIGQILPVSHVAAAISPWIGSVIYHVFMNHVAGHTLYTRLLQLDMLGIWVAESFGALTTVSAATYCLPSPLPSMAVTLYCFLSIWGLYKALNAWSPWERRLCFALPFLMRVLTFAVRVSPYGGGHPDALLHVILQDFLSIFGGVIGAVRVPEKWFPGHVDLWGNSHHLMHVLVVLAVVHMHVAASRDLAWMASHLEECPVITS